LVSQKVKLSMINQKNILQFNVDLCITKTKECEF
jgi:hypothetical protein